MSYHQSPRTFGRGSRVLEYWLAHGEGFRVRQGRRTAERVEAVHVDPTTGRARTLVVRSLLHRRRAVPADVVAAVDPFARELVLPQRHESQRLRLAAGQVGAAGRRLQPHAARGAATAARGSRVAAAGGIRSAVASARWLRPRLVQAAVQAAVIAALAGRAALRGLAAFLVWLRPRLDAWSRAAAATTGAAAVTAAELLHGAAARAKRRDPRDLQPDR